MSHYILPIEYILSDLTNYQINSSILAALQTPFPAYEGSEVGCIKSVNCCECLLLERSKTITFPLVF